METGRILIVDDAPDQLKIYSMLLRRQGYEVLEAATGKECLRIVREELPDLVLLDVGLPDLSGIDVCKEIRSDDTTAGILVTHVSGQLISDDHKAEALEAGADDCLTKPVDARTLLAHVKARLRIKRAEEELRLAHDELEKRVSQRTAELVGMNTFLKQEIAERKQAQEALAASEERYRELFENAKDAIYVQDLAGHFLSVNHAAEELSGYARDEIIGKHFSLFLVPEYLELVGCNLSTGPSDQTQTEYEIEVTTKDGRRVPVEVNSNLILDNGVAVAIQSMARDISERRRAQAELQSTNRLLKTLIESSPLAIVARDRDGNVSLWNTAAEHMFGWTEAEVLGRPNPMVPSGKERKFDAFCKEVIMWGTAETSLEKLRYRKDGTPIYISAAVAPLIGADGDSIGTIAITTDITERKRAAEKLKESEERLRALIEGVKDYAIFMLDCDGRIVSWNEGAKRINGYSQDEIMGKHFSCFYPAEQVRLGKPARALQTAIESDRYEDEGWRIRKDGTTFWANVVISASRDENGTLRGFSNVTRDVTDRKEAEQTRNQLLQKLVTAQEEERRRFSRELHDHMGQSLAALMLGLKSLEQSDNTEVSSNECLLQLKEITAQLTNEVHALARDLRPPALDDFGLHKALSNYVEEWSERSGINGDFHSNGLFTRRLPEHIETVVYRTVQEALNNVLKHAQARNVSVIAEYRQNRVLAIVEDDGCGFDADTVINDPKQRGLGLLGMQERAKLAGGKFNIDSRPGAGTTAFLRISIDSREPDNSHK